MTDFKVGDKVRRIGRHNGDYGACIGTIATVTKAYEDGFISVYYPGCYDDEDGSEIWATRLTELFQEPQHENGKDEEEGPVKSTTTLQDAYITMQEASGIEIGDTVRVLRKAADYEMGWGDGWDSEEMDDFIGREWEVTGVSDDLGVVLDNAWYFPFFVLEKVEDAPRFIEINGHKVPEPERKALKIGEEYWIPSFHYDSGSAYFNWNDDTIDNRLLRLGLVHKTKEAAEIHAKALLSFTSKED